MARELGNYWSERQKPTFAGFARQPVRIGKKCGHEAGCGCSLYRNGTLLERQRVNDMAPSRLRAP
jgi:hypothetical protein